MLLLLLPLLSNGAAAAPLPEGLPVCVIPAGLVVPLASSQVMAGEVLAAAECPGRPSPDLPLARLPSGQAGYALSCGQLARLAGRTAPAVPFRCHSETEEIRFLVESAQPARPCSGRAAGAVREENPPADDCGVPARRAGPVALRGETVTGAAAFGPVLVERELELLQPAWPGRKVFARDREGAIVVLSVSGEGGVP